jgi:hypothetical protein
MNFRCRLGADARDQPPSGQRPGGHLREPKLCSSSFWSSSSSSPRRSCCAAASTSRQTALTRRAHGHRSRTDSPAREDARPRGTARWGREEIMTAIKAAHAAPRQRTSPRNGLPEPVPYVYGQQTRRNTYAARIAQRNIQGWWHPPAALPGPKVTGPQAPRGPAAQVNPFGWPSVWAEILMVAHGELHRADLERLRFERSRSRSPEES